MSAKLGLVGRFIDILLTRRLWNLRSIAYSTMQYAMFTVMRDIRGLAVKALAIKLHEILGKEHETFANNDRLRVHQQNRYALHRILARLTDHLETESGLPSRYLDYIAEGRKRYEVEHVWANHYEQHTDELDNAADFAEQRNRIGGLLLLPKSFNASYGDMTYEEKLPHYDSQNLLARSLGTPCYSHNPGFVKLKKDSGLPFKAHSHFKKADMEKRSALYRQIAERIWNADDLLGEVEP